MTQKRCTCCGECKDYTDFYDKASARDGKLSLCKVCQLNKTKKWRENPANKNRQRELTRKWNQDNRTAYLRMHKNQRIKKYGITLDEKEAMIIAQDNKCAICDNDMVGKREPAVDHDHKTGKIRMLLCTRCNLMLGYAVDDVQILENAIKYLRFFSKI